MLTANPHALGRANARAIAILARTSPGAVANARALAEQGRPVQPSHGDHLSAPVIPSRPEARASAQVSRGSLGWDAAPQSDAVSTARVVVTRLKGEISKLEAQNDAKVTQVNQLTQQLAQRKAEIQREYDRKRTIGLIGALFGAPMLTAAALITMQNDDGRVQQINRDLATAQADQQRIASRIASYNKLKSGVESQIKTLEAPIHRTGDVAGTPKELAKLLESSETLAHLEREKVLLTSVRDAAKAIGIDLDGAIGRLNGAIASADKALEASRKETLALIKALLAPDPNKAGFDMIKGMAKDRIKQLFAPNVDNALSGVADGPLKKELRSRLLSAVADAFLG
jgi:hypothetical protein